MATATMVAGAKVERAKELDEAEFVHATGLLIYHPKANPPGMYAIQPRRAHLGHFHCSGGKAVIVTTDGEVWVRFDTGHCFTFGARNPYTMWAPKGHGPVPCFIGTLSSEEVDARRINPYDDINGARSPIPQIMD